MHKCRRDLQLEVSKITNTFFFAHDGKTFFQIFSAKPLPPPWIRLGSSKINKAFLYDNLQILQWNFLYLLFSFHGYHVKLVESVFSQSNWTFRVPNRRWSFDRILRLFRGFLRCAQCKSRDSNLMLLYHLTLTAMSFLDHSFSDMKAK